MPTGATVEVLRPGLQTTIQDGGRAGYLAKGIPPAGAQDLFSFRVASRLVGNRVAPPLLSIGDPGEAGLEMLLGGPTLKFDSPALIALTGADLDARVDGESIPSWEAVEVPADGVLEIGKVVAGARAYLAIAGGIDVPTYLGSRSTYVRGRQGGLEGRALRKGDRLSLEPERVGGGPARVGKRFPDWLRPAVQGPWEIRVVLGPQDHLFTDDSVATFFDTDWTLSPTSDRMGFRFGGATLEFKPRAEYLVRDAGSDPSNIVDDVIPVGGIQVPSGAEPIVLGVENPTAGGYAKIATVISSDLGVVGQMRPGESARFVAISLEEALAAAEDLEQRLVAPLQEASA
ncbi:MAG: biotin-dependent carboxyltransferase family protein [Microvirga sp.]